MGNMTVTAGDEWTAGPAHATLRDVHHGASQQTEKLAVHVCGPHDTPPPSVGPWARMMRAAGRARRDVKCRPSRPHLPQLCSFTSVPATAGSGQLWEP